MHLCGNASSLEQKQLFGDQFWPIRLTEEVTRFTKTLFLNFFSVSNVFVSLQDLLFLSNDSSCRSNFSTCADPSASGVTNGGAIAPPVKCLAPPVKLYIKVIFFAFSSKLTRSIKLPKKKFLISSV